MSESTALQSAISALESQRAALGDAVVDVALAPMRERLEQLAQDAPPEQTLRQVSVLFLDVAGSTGLSQHLDPEDMHDVIDDVLQRCTAVVTTHGGKVLQYAGDSLLAAFGAEHAREDDAERAVHCGLALLQEGRGLAERVEREHGQRGCHVRVGIHSGPVLLGGGVDGDGTIRGLTVNVAARMEQTAPPGALRISRETWLLVRGIFEVDDQPPLMVKGRDEPLASCLVRHAKTPALRLPSRGIEGVWPPMAGRSAELAQLTAMLRCVGSQRVLRMATVIGEPGLGKSRLLHELQGALDDPAQRFRLLLGRAHPGSRLQPYGMLRDLLARRLQIGDSDSGEQARAKLVAGLLPDLGERAEAKAHWIGQIIGLDFSASGHLHGVDPGLLRTLAFSALHDWLRGLAADGAVALLVEDLHWADEASLAFFAGLAADARLPLAVVATARPELLERCPDWGEGHADALRIPLAALDAAQSASLARSLLSRVAEGREALHALLVARAEGNPFYMEELLRMLLDDGVIVAGADTWRVLPDRLGAARVPTTLVGVLQARLDGLPAPERAALQRASIIGPVFWDQALAAVDPQAPAALPALQQRALIHRRSHSSFEDTPEEAFHHHLLQQVTYDTVLKPMRRAGHAATAGWLAARLGDRPSEHLAITAEHYERAGDTALALEYFERAALDAQGRFANAAALECVERALRNPAAVDLRLRERLYRLQENVADLVGQRTLQEAALAQREAIAEALDDDALRADLLVARALLASRRSDETLSSELARRALEAAVRSGNADAEALALGQIAWSQYCSGALPPAAEHVQRAIARVRASRRRDDTAARRQIEVKLLTMRGIFHEAACELEQGRSALTEALDLARALGARRQEAGIQQSLGAIASSAGRHSEARPRFAESVKLADAIGWTIGAASSRYNLARCHFNVGDTSACIEQLEIAEAEARRCENREIEGRCLLLRGRLAADAGNAEAARQGFDRAAAVFAAMGAAAFGCQVRTELALLDLAQGALPAACAAAEQISAELARGLSLDSTEDPLRPQLACHRIWLAAGDARAAAAIDDAYAALRALAARVADADTRASMLQNIPLHHDVATAWRAQAARPSTG